MTIKFFFQGIACIALMHIIGTSLCFWISAIVRETILALTLYAQSIYGKQEGNFTEHYTPVGTYTLKQTVLNILLF